VFQYGEIYNFPQVVFEKALDDEEMVQEDTEAGGDDESASEPEDDKQVRISYCIRGQRDLCSVSVNLLSASKNISVPGLIPGAGVVICLERAADLYMAQLMHCHSLSLASLKSRLVLRFWYRLTWVVPEKGR